MSAGDPETFLGSLDDYCQPDAATRPYGGIGEDTPTALGAAGQTGLCELTFLQANSCTLRPAFVPYFCSTTRRPMTAKCGVLRLCLSKKKVVIVPAGHKNGRKNDRAVGGGAPAARGFAGCLGKHCCQDISGTWI